MSALSAESFVHGTNSLGVALTALMRVSADRRVTVKAEALSRTIHSSENDYRKFLLTEFIQTYMQLDDAEQRQFDLLTNELPYREVKQMATTWFEQGIEQGIERGSERTARELILRAVANRFGEVTDATRDCINAWPADRLTELFDAYLSGEVC